MGVNGSIILILWFLLVFLIPNSLNPSVPVHSLVVWNVGQGQWITWVSNEACLHFDLGGEFFPREVLKVCELKENQIALTHWDYDHTRFTFKLIKSVFNSCILSLPEGTHRIAASLKKLKSCGANYKVKENRPQIPSGELKDNDLSTVFLLFEKVLITGDLSQRQERKRLRSSFVKKVQIYLAGHHGSHTSSSNALVQKMKSLNLVLVSARKRKYGHPHAEVTTRFYKNKTPVLKTEDWGHISIEF